jgi:hypothetical protein
VTGTVAVSDRDTGYLCLVDVETAVPFRFGGGTAEGGAVNWYLADPTALESYWDGGDGAVYASFSARTRRARRRPRSSSNRSTAPSPSRTRSRSGESGGGEAGERGCGTALGLISLPQAGSDQEIADGFVTKTDDWRHR